MELNEQGIAMLVGALVFAATVTLALSAPQGETRFCEAYGIITEGVPVSHEGALFMTGLKSEERNSGCFEPFGHYMVHLAPDRRSMNMEGYEIDGVIWNDCIITWADGSQVPADQLGVPCSR